MTNTVSNPQSRMELLALAERVEKATGPSRELDALIGVAFQIGCRKGLPDDHEYLTAIRADDPEASAGRAGHYWFHCRSGKSMRSAEMYTASIDGAMTLLPGPNWEYSIEWQAGSVLYVPEASMVAIVKIGDPKLMMEAEATTPALALVAACLRSIAAMEGE
jgi:hypothetical protein